MQRGRSARGYDGVGFRQLTPGERAAMDETRKRMARAFLRGDAASYGAELAVIHGLLALTRGPQTRRQSRLMSKSAKQDHDDGAKLVP